MNARGRRGIRIASLKLAANKEVRHEATAAFRDGRPGGRAVVRLPRPRAAAPPRTRQPQPRTQQNPPLPQTVPTTSAKTVQCTSGGNCYDNNTTGRDINATDNDNTPRNNPKFSSLAGS